MRFWSPAAKENATPHGQARGEFQIAKEAQIVKNKAKNRRKYFLNFHIVNTDDSQFFYGEKACFARYFDLLRKPKNSPRASPWGVLLQKFSEEASAFVVAKPCLGIIQVQVKHMPHRAVLLAAVALIAAGDALAVEQIPE